MNDEVPLPSKQAEQPAPGCDEHVAIALDNVHARYQAWARHAFALLGNALAAIGTHYLNQ